MNKYVGSQPSSPQGYQHIWAWCKHLLPSRVGRPCCGMWRSSPRWRVCRCEEVGVGVEDDIVVDDASVVDVVIDADLVVSVVDVMPMLLMVMVMLLMMMVMLLMVRSYLAHSPLV